MFSSNSNLLQQTEVKTAVMSHSNIAQSAFAFDQAHQEAEQNPTLKFNKVAAKRELLNELNSAGIKANY